MNIRLLTTDPATGTAVAVAQDHTAARIVSIGPADNWCTCPAGADGCAHVAAVATRLGAPPTPHPTPGPRSRWITPPAQLRP